jgi:tetratricopeptide (TPR) repeat protein
MISKSQRLLLILDDAHWVDEASLDVLMYLQGRLPFEKQALAIIASRLDEPNQRFKKFLALSRLNENTTIMNLPPMDLNEINLLLHQLLGAPPPTRFITHLAHETGGNPFFILETFHALINQQPVPDLESLDNFPLAESISSLIQARFQSLSHSARSILEVAAIIGKEFQTNTLAKVSDLSPDEAALALDELTDRNLIIKSDQPEPHPKYHFFHDQFREVALHLVNPLRAQIIHRKIAFSLSEDEEERLNHPALIAYHFEAAEEYLQAYNYWVTTGQRDRQLCAISNASQAFRNAEKLIDHCINLLTEQQIYSLYRDWGEMAYASNDKSTLQSINASLMSLGERLNSPLLKGTALVRFGNACFSSGQLEEGFEHTRLAIELLSSTDNIYQLTNAHANLGVFHYMTGHVNEAIQVLESALELVKDRNDRDLISLRANLNYELGMSLFLNGQPKKSVKFALHSLRDHNAFNNLEGITTAYSELTLASYYLGNYSQGFHYSQLGIESATQSQSWRMLGYLYDYRAMLEYVTGHLDAMLEYAEQAIKLGREIGQVDIYATAYRLMSDAFYLMEDYGKSLEYLKLAYVENQKSFVIFDIQYRMKSLLFTLDRKEERLSELKEMIHFAQFSGLITGKLLAQIALMMAFQELQQWQDARGLAYEVKEESLSRGFRAFVIAANLILARCEWQAGRQKYAFELLLESIQEAESLPVVWLEIKGRMLLDIFSKQIGQDAEANRQRIMHLLDTVHQNCQKSFFSSTLQSYTNHIQHLLA